MKESHCVMRWIELGARKRAGDLYFGGKIAWEAWGLLCEGEPLRPAMERARGPE